MKEIDKLEKRGSNSSDFLTREYTIEDLEVETGRENIGLDRLHENSEGEEK